MSKSEAISGFNESTLDDLLFYDLLPSEAHRVSRVGNVDKIVTPRTYALFLNSKTIKKIEERKAIISKLDPKELVSICYPEERHSVQIIPPGFPGHYPRGVERAVESSSGFRFKHPIQIAVVDISRNAECMKGQLSERLKALNAHVTIVPLEKFMKGWLSDKYDGFFAFVDAEDTDTMLSDFSPTSRLHLGDVSDSVYALMLRSYLAIRERDARMKKAEELSRRILSRATVLPVFHPAFYAIYSKRFEKIDFSLKSPCFIQIENFKPIEQ